MGDGAETYQDRFLISFELSAAGKKANEMRNLGVGKFAHRIKNLYKANVRDPKFMIINIIRLFAPYVSGAKI